jgi:hypothetical protein
MDDGLNPDPFDTSMKLSAGKLRAGEKWVKRRVEKSGNK